VDDDRAGFGCRRQLPDPGDHDRREHVEVFDGHLGALAHAAGDLGAFAVAGVQERADVLGVVGGGAEHRVDLVEQDRAPLLLGDAVQRRDRRFDQVPAAPHHMLERLEPP
jgi:hypothetical protein